MLLVLEEKADVCSYTQTGTNNSTFKCSTRPLIVAHHLRLYFLSFPFLFLIVSRTVVSLCEPRRGEAAVSVHSGLPNAPRCAVCWQFIFLFFLFFENTSALCQWLFCAAEEMKW